MDIFEKYREFESIEERVEYEPTEAEIAFNEQMEYEEELIADFLMIIDDFSEEDLQALAENDIFKELDEKHRRNI